MAFDSLGMTPGLPDDTFEHDGLVTKRVVRAVALASLRPMPDQVLWDLGAGAGSVSIEWCRGAVGATAVAVERHPERLARLRRNTGRLAPGAVNVVEASVTSALLETLPTPDAVFVGGGGSTEVVDAAYQRLVAGGRIVVHGVTLQTEALCWAAYQRYGGVLQRIAVESAEPLAGLVSFTPARAVTHWAAVRT